jgi:CRISPR/Cas system CMR subunit Cmr6 (Cas7 group RAMP superfamily)
METRPLPLPLDLAHNGPHHLDSLAAEIHRTYFFKFPPLRVRWGHNSPRKRRRSIRLGSYNHVTSEIRIHPLLNAPHIPAFFIQSVIHHEYLHHVLGANHNRRFHAHERQFHYHRESKEWLRRNLWGLLGIRRKRDATQTRALSQMALF